MSVKKGYNRYFIIFQEEDKGYGIAIDKQPTGYAKIEVKNGKCKVTVYAQNIKKEKGPYNFCMIDTNKSPANLVRLGEVRIDDAGTGETYWEYNEDNVCDSGYGIENYNVAVLLAEADIIPNADTVTGMDRYEVSAPLSGYTGKERVLWKEKINTSKMEEFGENNRNEVKEGLNKQTTRNTDLELDDEMIEELDEEGKKFKEYEAAIKNVADRMSKAAFEEEKSEQVDSDSFQTPNTHYEEDTSIYEFRTEQEMDRHNKHGHKNSNKGKKQHDFNYGNENHEHDHEYDYDYDHDDSSIDHNHYDDDHMGCGFGQNQGNYYNDSNGYDHMQDMDEDDGYNRDHSQSSDDHNGYNYNYHQSSDSYNQKSCMSHKHKNKRTYADIFHHLLQEFEELSENLGENEMDKVRWWKIPYKYDAKLINEKHYPFMCTIFHLSMAYPHLDYIKYFYETGHYYFGIKYDENNEVKYLMYGIVGRNDIKDQPYMGMTGFNKWVGKPNKEMGVWIMFYNPKTGNIMIEKNK